MRKILVLSFVLAAAPLASRAQVPSPAPFPLELALGIRSPSQTDRLAMSGDGKYVAYTIAEVARPATGDPAPDTGAPPMYRGLRLYVVGTASGEIDWVSSETATAWAASWSPDGTTVAFYSDAGGEVGLWSHRVGDAGASRLGTFVVGASHHMRPEWTPDGSQILVPTVARDATGGSECASDAAANREPTPAERKGPTVVVRTTGAERPAEPDPAPTPADATPASTVQPLVAGPPAALAEVNAVDGSVTQILPAGDQAEFVAAKLSPSGKVIACERSLRAVFDGGLAVLVDLALVRRADGATIHQAEGISLDVNIDPTSPTLVAMAWHPTEDRLAYLRAGRLIVVDVTAAQPIARELPLGADAARAERIRFTPDGRTLLVSVLAGDSPVEDPFLAHILAISTSDGVRRDLLPPDGVRLRGAISASWRTAWQPAPDAIVVAGTDAATGESVFARMPLDGTQATVIRRADGRLRVVAAAEGGRAVALVEDSATAPDYFLLGPDLTPTQRLSRAEPLLEGVAVGPVESFTTEIESNGERRTVCAVVALPPGGKRGDRFPTIVTLYPGQELSRQARSFGGGAVSTIPAAVFTTRGYAVLVLDVPLAPFGVPSNPLRDIQTAALPQVRKAVDLGYSDSERIGVAGHSYGGYGAACLACGTSEFKAAIAFSGSYDLAGLYATQRPDEPETSGLTMNMALLEQHQGRMGKPLWDDPQRYLDNSPYFHAGEIHTPMLLVHGREDTNCPPGEAEKLFNALKRLEHTAQLALYEGEGHVLEEWSRENRLDVTTRTLAFFERYLR
ncbi:MAG: prolyl oligopeptidase family serine peptidase [Planctomycetes bacterium]|nr:prolyl oligopeptidase family serine peptidase [Planctomycetota bacterium]